jgi:hypothetical protein
VFILLDFIDRYPRLAHARDFIVRGDSGGLMPMVRMEAGV